jgi:potassium-dependent mechanosensitive channel
MFRCLRLALAFALFTAAVPLVAVGQQSPAPSAPVTAPPAATPPAATPPAAPPAPAAAPPSTPITPLLPPEVTNPVEKLAKSIETAEKSIQQLKELEGELQRLRGNVEQIIYDSTATAEALRPQLAEVKSQIEKLGAPPAANQPPESATVVAERARLNAMAGALDGAVKTAELAWVRAKQLIDRITVMRYQIFARNLFERRASPVLPTMWRDVGERLPNIIGRSQYYGNDWLQWVGRKGASVAGVIAGALASYLLIWLAVRRLVIRRRDHDGTIPTFFDRIISAAKVAPARMLAPMAALGLIYTGFDMLELWFSPWEHAAEIAAQGGLIFIVGSTLASVALAPRQPQWRLIPVDDRTASRLLFFVKAIVAVYIMDTVLVEFGRAIYVPLTITVAQSFVTNIATAVLLVALLLTPFVPQTGPLRAVNGLDHLNVDPVSRHAPLWIKLPLWMLTLGIIAASAIGYVALGRFISQQIVLTGTVMAIAGLFYLAVRAVTRERSGERSRVGGLLESRFGIDSARQGQLVKLGEITATFALVLLALPLLLLQWGFAAADIRDWAKALFFGFEIGQFRISLVRILIGVLLFIALLFLTRMTQRWLRDRVMAKGRVDPGVANSVDTAIGYVGIGLAALISVSYAGFDITSLAIVAGALSVGIGFGLQSIVNNFVSGLILLVERPIKVGDWIVVGDQQGNVRRISVRSTEIETFDRASLIVPNSELISGRVLNWTHRNLLGRVILKLTTDAQADPEKVLAILEQSAREQEQVLPSPSPMAALDAFAPDHLEFSLRVNLSDVTTSGRVKSNLHVAILKAFRKAGIYATIQSSVTVAEAPAATVLAAHGQPANALAAAPQTPPAHAGAGMVTRLPGVASTVAERKD